MKTTGRRILLGLLLAGLVGAQGNLSAQYEHTMIITRGAPIVVTA